MAVVSYGFAQRRFGGAGAGPWPDHHHQRHSLHDCRRDTPGIPGINPGQRHDIYAPMQSSLQVERIYAGNARERFYDPRRYWVEILGRLKPG